MLLRALRNDDGCGWAGRSGGISATLEPHHPIPALNDSAYAQDGDVEFLRVSTG